jgi:uncharacterized protein YbbC (DUF1343 family)
MRDRNILIRFFQHCIFFILAFLIHQSGTGQVRIGAERMDLITETLKGKAVALVANRASVVSGVNVVDTLLSAGVNVIKVFSPEHGFRDFSGAGETISDTADAASTLPVTSLYGKKKKPSPEDLKGIDILVFDIQDVGVRFYTYISTLTYVMEACAENRIPMVVLDRPNPNGFYIDGPVLEPGFASFVGLHPVPVVYGMTIGEYAMMVNGERWLKNGAVCSLTVITIQNYTHQTVVEIPFNPSPNLTSMNAISLYPSLCFFEGTPVSVGRGTVYPFEVFGHPEFKGYSFSFVPESIPGMATDPPFEGQLCRGLDLRGFYASHPRMKGRINLSWLMLAHKNLGSGPDFFTSYFDQLAGSDQLRLQMLEGKTESQIRLTWLSAIDAFKKIREKYLLYPE